MIKARALLPDGRHLLVLGISEGNVTRLRDGQPITFDMAALKAEGDVGQVVLFYGATDDELSRTVKTLIGPSTELIVVPRGTDTVS